MKNVFLKAFRKYFQVLNLFSMETLIGGEKFSNSKKIFKKKTSLFLIELIFLHDSYCDATSALDPWIN